MSQVSCGNCDRPLDEDPQLDASARTPCPHCGSFARKSAVTVSAIVGVEATASMGAITAAVRSIANVSDLLLQTVVVPGEKTTEGRLIEAVAVPWFAIVDLLSGASFFRKS